MHVAGIDIGSAFSKGIVVADSQVLNSCILPTGGAYNLTVDLLKQGLLTPVGLTLNNIDFTVATGIGAKMVIFANEVKTELACHAKGIISLFPTVRTVVDIGDSYSKAFRIDKHGNLLRFLLSNKCAGGSARILKKIAKIVNVAVEGLGELSLKSTKPVDFNTNCAVFAESEAISRIAEGTAKEDLVAGIHRALAAQLNSLAERLGIEKDFALVGGGAKNVGLIRAVEEITGLEMFVPPEPQLNAALGAAIIAKEVAMVKKVH